MPVNLQEKLAAFRVKPSPKLDPIMLPSAFICRTVKQVGMIPSGAEVIAERNVMGNFALTWWDDREREVNQTITPDALDLTEIVAKHQDEVLAAIPIEQLEATVARRKAAVNER